MSNQTDANSQMWQAIGRTKASCLGSGASRFWIGNSDRIYKEESTDFRESQLEPELVRVLLWPLHAPTVNAALFSVFGGHRWGSRHGRLKRMVAPLPRKAYLGEIYWHGPKTAFVAPCVSRTMEGAVGEYGADIHCLSLAPLTWSRR